MRMIDITLPLGPDTPVYPGDPPVEVVRLREAGAGDAFALSRVTLGSHSGTHVDPPAHFLPGGATVDALPLAPLIGPAVVADVAHGRPVTAADLAPFLPAVRLLLRSGGMPLTPEAARAVVAVGVRLVGVDGLSVAPPEAPGEVHRILLAAGVVIVEGLALAGVTPGRYTLICLPLKLTGGDGAPARAVLIADADEGLTGHDM
jgi:arylformamidase